MDKAQPDNDNNKKKIESIWKSINKTNITKQDVITYLHSSQPLCTLHLQ